MTLTGGLKFFSGGGHVGCAEAEVIGSFSLLLIFVADNGFARIFEAEIRFLILK